MPLLGCCVSITGKDISWVASSRTRVGGGRGGGGRWRKGSRGTTKCWGRLVYWTVTFCSFIKQHFQTSCIEEKTAERIIHQSSNIVQIKTTYYIGCLGEESGMLHLLFFVQPFVTAEVTGWLLLLLLNGITASAFSKNGCKENDEWSMSWTHSSHSSHPFSVHKFCWIRPKNRLVQCHTSNNSQVEHEGMQYTFPAVPPPLFAPAGSIQWHTTSAHHFFGYILKLATVGKKNLFI